MHFEGPKYGRYMKEECCPACDYAGGYLDLGGRLPPMPISICPECGEKLTTIIGRWNYSVKVTWFGCSREVIKHKFVKGGRRDK